MNDLNRGRVAGPGVTPRPQALSPLQPEQLRWRCDPDQLGFASTDEVPPLETTAGQERGVGAIAFGLELPAHGYNVYVAGPLGSGRTSTVRSQVESLAATRSAPSDWCYLHNFQDPQQPVAVELPSGRAPELARDLDELVASFRREIPRVFEGEAYQQRRSALGHQLNQQREALFDQIRAFAEAMGFGIESAPTGITAVPLLERGKPLTPQAFELLPDDRKADIRSKGAELEARIGDTLLRVRHLDRDAHEQVQTLDRETVGFAVGHLLDALRSKYAGMPRVGHHLEAIQTDLVDHLEEMRASEPESAAPTPLGPASRADERYGANVLVTHDVTGGAPVVFEPNPTYYNLLGRVDYRPSMGAMVTDFALVRDGALHRANGGYLVLQARDVLGSPYAWDVLKRALRERELRIENIGDHVGSLPPASLKPQSIPLEVKVVLIGDTPTYGVLSQMDPDFPTLFKVKAQFGPDMQRSADTVRAYAAFVSAQVRGQGLLPFGSDAVARIVEHGARLAEHQDRLVTRFDAIADVLVEAAHAARGGGAQLVVAGHVDAALAAREHRLNLVEEDMQRMIDEGTIAIDTHTQVIGQVNGLSVLDVGDFAFARPSRITARVGLGEEGLVDIEREVKLSGPTHSKGILILTGYLLGKYAHDIPLALSARLTFEQVYGGVDGDSASSAELYALLSSLSDVPLRQGVAVTGSVNQRGEIQAVGGVTTKIEGFFAVCKSQGLDGQQGVIIPAANSHHLMLKPEVVDAVREDQFHVWSVQSIDQGLELLTGLPAGERQPDGGYPTETIHGLVQRRLAEFARHLRDYAPRRSTGAESRTATNP